MRARRASASDAGEPSRPQTMEPPDGRRPTPRILNGNYFGLLSPDECGGGDCLCCTCWVCCACVCCNCCVCCWCFCSTCFVVASSAFCLSSCRCSLSCCCWSFCRSCCCVAYSLFCCCWYFLSFFALPVFGTDECSIAGRSFGWTADRAPAFSTRPF